MLLLMLYPQPILLLLDRASWHFGQVTDLIEHTDRLQVLYFPPACPELNPQEHVWERARDAVSHNHTYRHFQSLIDDFETYLNETLFSTDFMDAFTPLGLGVF
jgi:transposase